MRRLGDISSIQSQIIQAANQQGIPSSIALSVAQTESSFNPNARGAAGEVGLYQLMPSSFPGQNISDVGTNISLGISYLKSLYAQFGDWATALAAYNWGPTKVSNAISSGTPYPSSVNSYVQTTLARSPDASVPLPDDLLAGVGTMDASAVSFDPSWILIGFVGMLALWWVLD